MDTDELHEFGSGRTAAWNSRNQASVGALHREDGSLRSTSVGTVECHRTFVGTIPPISETGAGSGRGRSLPFRLERPPESFDLVVSNS